ncbi:MAG: class I SAM-dependent RNA methyltransferase [Clostridia bacterium]|nr:class I SAM-dependent RNA methyltransferase [Clostridia bacterium]
MAENKYKIAVSCASGVESVVKKELQRLGYFDTTAINGKIEVEGNDIDIAKLNICLRSADRVYIKLASFSATAFDELFDGVYGIPFEEYIDVNGRILVDGKCVKSKLFAVSACQSIVKKAVVERLKDKKKIRLLREDGADYKIEFSVFKDVAEIYLNTSGTGLHKRGYRDLVGIAPIKETLASALLLLSDVYYDKPFFDPFCGSGTLVIEGAKIALNIAPNKDRKFDFNFWKFFDKNAYNSALNEAVDKERRDRKIDFSGSDVDGKAIKLAKHHAIKAGVSDYVSFSVKDVKDVKLEKRNGTIVSNPPYGERVFDREQADVCYNELGRLKSENPDWSFFVITSAKNFEKKFGYKSERTRKLYNSNKECRFYYYYGNKKRDK